VNGQLETNGKRFFVKGLNWGGLETEARQLDGLDQISARDFLDTLKGLGFNAVSIKISTTMGLDLDGAVRKETADADLAGLSVGQVLHKVVSMAGERGIQVVLDMARIDETQPAPDLWCVRWDACVVFTSNMCGGAALLPTICLTFLPLPHAD
jgi:aryl-phospho-beta-D-glucosidase BglC (GH1 family)